MYESNVVARYTNISEPMWMRLHGVQPKMAAPSTGDDGGRFFARHSILSQDRHTKMRVYNTDTSGDDIYELSRSRVTQAGAGRWHYMWCAHAYCCLCDKATATTMTTTTLTSATSWTHWIHCVYVYVTGRERERESVSQCVDAMHHHPTIVHNVVVPSHNREEHGS